MVNGGKGAVLEKEQGLDTPKEYDGEELKVEDGGGKSGEEVDEESLDDDEVDEVALAELLALNGWCSAKTPLPYHFHPIQNSSNIPSPFADPDSDINEQLWDLMSGPVQQLWRAFRSKLKPAERHIPHDGSVACCGFHNEDDIVSPTKYYTIEAADPGLIVDIEDFTKCFHLRRMKRARGPNTSIEGGFFIVNKNCDRFLVNGQVMSRGAVAGPLPGFAVIELDSTAIFWWRNQAALSYTPTIQYRTYRSASSLVNASISYVAEQILSRDDCGSKRGRSVEDVQESKKSKRKLCHGDGHMTSGFDEHASVSRKRSTGIKEVPTSSYNLHKRHDNTPQPGSSREAPHTSSPSARTWQDILQDGMAQHRQHKARMEAQEKAQPTGPVTRLKRPDGLSEDETILAIAVFWEALRRNGQLFAFAGVDFFGQANSNDDNFQLESQGVVGAPANFIMPLLLHPHKRKDTRAADKTEVLGHLVLAIAEWARDKEKIRLDLLDSLSKHSGIFKKDMIERAKELIIGSRWPYDQEKQPRPAFFSAVTTLASPQQEGQNTCGFYMILNAWCVMLGIPISKTEKRRVRTKAFRAFLRDGLEMINLALMGCMDAYTVQAFLNVWGYSQEQIPEEAVAENVTAVRMDMQLLRRALYQQAVAEGRGYQPTPKEVTDLIHATGLKERVTFDEMEALLIEEEGDSNRAIVRLLSPSPLLSPAAKALQTKTETQASDDGESASLSSEQQLKRAIELSQQPWSPASLGNVTDEGTNPPKRNPSC